MLIAVVLAPADPLPDVDPLTAEVRTGQRAVRLSPGDAAALERALRIADGLRAAAGAPRLLAVAAGPACHDSALREAAALGAEVLRVARPAELPEDAEYEAHTADALAGALTRGGARPDLVLCGAGPADAPGALSAFLAHRLGAAQALGLVSLAPSGGGPGSGLTGVRRLDRGRREVLDIPLPAVCSVEGAGTELRRAPLAAALAAAGAPVPVLRAPAPRPRVRTVSTGPARPRARPVPPPEGDAHRRILALTGALERPDRPTVLGPLGAAEAADALLAFLRRHGHLPEG
ncbi:mycofactocin-associated electron transfer flavoprotein beta subunit [Nocardiopsis composta]|uniref:Electron transfer flavoprotein beta subunit n=1 Tax=Nocardiopsis composta TaxID=157465 RepID=A0A7W8VBW4_9ACTN|nr:mycofactocin-associated electron transfer flavoprotein beta subunit [Nocardiopsis composta]MBB5430330.1 electron transfer flavoprotein beta subunit [Nocardiopsis composta]